MIPGRLSDDPRELDFAGSTLSSPVDLALIGHKRRHPPILVTAIFLFFQRHFIE